ncbi:MAG: DNA mismatch repair protein MutS, partial [Clostridiales bacterium]|nr:DNA mismatch repair protein MutS [Clostridiales bacterium]
CFEYQSEDYLQKLDSLLSALNPSETICRADDLKIIKSIPFFEAEKEVRPTQASCYGYDTAVASLRSQFKTATLAQFECEDKKLAIGAAGGLISYLKETQKRHVGQIFKLNYIKDGSFMLLDSNTRKNLEITARAKDGKRQGSLLHVLDRCRTAMGSRRLKTFLEQPLQDINKISERQDAIEEFFLDISLRNDISLMLDNVGDLERLSGRAAYGSVTPKDCLAINRALKIIPDIKTRLKECKSALLKSICASIQPHDDIAELLEKAISDNAAEEGGIIKSDYSSELYQLRNIRALAKRWLEELERAERENTGIRTLKIGFNKVFGYYIEVSKSFVDKVPYRFQRKQTLTTGERYITEELKEIEEKILNAEENAQRIEAEIFAQIKEKLSDISPSLLLTANALSVLDALISFAEVSMEYGYTRPKFTDKKNVLQIKGGRHAVVERIVGSMNYVPNDTLLDGENNRTMIITGPNMAGKSTYMRQVAVIALLAHTGCFVPADYVELSLIDRIFTRIGASDDLGGGRSTFMVEMIEVATILNNATDKSLLILDEIGRGTSTIDGLSIAWASVEWINKKIKAKTLFATHFLELAELGGMDGIKNYQITVKEIGGSVLFLHKIAPGGASKSFGIEVASLAGVNREVVERAKTIMNFLEAERKELKVSAINEKLYEQIDLYSNIEDMRPDKEEKQLHKNAKSIIEILNSTDLNNCTPLSAFNLLAELIKLAKEN